MNVALHPQNSLDLISLCTGGGGLDLGIELALPDARSVVMVEREAFAVAHLVAAIEQGLLAPAAIYSDVRTFDGRPWRGLVDGLIGGIPCQPHSLAGRKQGSFDARDLWSDARRHIVTARPWFVIIENVAGMLAAGADEIAGAERVWRDLLKLGFAVEIGLFTATEVRASHQRERLFILGVADPHGDHAGRYDRTGSVSGAGRKAEGEASGSDGEWSRAGPRDGGQDLANADNAGPQGRRHSTDPFRRQAAQRHAGLGGGELGYPASGNGPIARQSQIPNTGSRRRKPGRSGGAVEDAGSDGYGREPSDDVPGRPVVDRAGSAAGELDLYPPGPADFDGWQRVLAHSPDLEPAVRRMADGVAARLDLTGPHAARVDRLRLLGNGVVSLEAAHAVRTLVTRLAARGAAGAVELARRLRGVS